MTIGNFPAPLGSPPEKTSSGDSILGDYDELDIGHVRQSVKAEGTGGDRGWHLAAMGAQFWGQESEIGRSERRGHCTEFGLYQRDALHC